MTTEQRIDRISDIPIHDNNASAVAAFITNGGSVIYCAPRYADGIQQNQKIKGKR
jgi:hypothetical protein